MKKNNELVGIRCLQGKQRALSALMSLSFAVTLGIGCSSNGPSEEAGLNPAADSSESNDAAENALIESHLQSRGFDTSNLQFQGDTVIVDNDMVMQRASLLDEAQAQANGEVEKGYFAGTTLFAGKRIQSRRTYSRKEPSLLAAPSR